MTVLITISFDTNELMGKKHNAKSIKQLEINNQITENQQEIADKFNDYVINIGPTLAKKIPASKKLLSEYHIRSYSDSMFLFPTTDMEIIKIIHDLKNSSSSDYNGIPVKVIKQCSTELSHILTYINNQSMSDGIFPDQLKIAKVTPIHKAGDIKCLANYRPISVLPALSKISEKLVYERLLEYLNKHGILSKNQFGFRSKMSTSMALLQLVDDLSRVMDDGEYAVGIFVDLAKAFDTVNHKILINKLNHYGIRGTSLKWFESYLNNRQQYVQIETSRSKQSLVSCGVPQGSILGPLLFLIYINDLNDIVQKSRIIMFADDTNLFFSGKSALELEIAINNELALVNEWFQVNLLSLNVAKTTYIIFCNKRKRSIDLDCNMQNSKLNRQHDTKFLGVILSSDLKWNMHINVVISKTSKSMGIISKIRHYVSPQITRMLYLTLVEPYFNYCNIVWACLNKSSSLEKLLKIQKSIVGS